jgi:hypothetical protein
LLTLLDLKLEATRTGPGCEDGAVVPGQFRCTRRARQSGSRPPPGPRRRRRRGPPPPPARAQWRRQYREFAATPLGRGAFLAGVFALFYTGIAFRLLNLLVLLWWVGPLIALPLLQAASRKARARPRAPRTRRRASSSAAAASQVCVRARLCVGCACAAAPGAAC